MRVRVRVFVVYSISRYEMLLLGLKDNSWPEAVRSEEHTSELQSLTNLVCRLLLEKKNKKTATIMSLTFNRRKVTCYV